MRGVNQNQVNGTVVRYSPALADEICQRLAQGEGLIAICRDAHMPHESSVRQWVDENRDGFAPKYARARELQYGRMADEIAEIADDGRNDWMANIGDAGYEINGEHITRSRLRVDARKWLLSKLLPKQFGDKVDHTLAGTDGGPVVFKWQD